MLSSWFFQTNRLDEPFGNVACFPQCFGAFSSLPLSRYQHFFFSLSILVNELVLNMKHYLLNIFHSSKCMTPHVYDQEAGSKVRMTVANSHSITTTTTIFSPASLSTFTVGYWLILLLVLLPTTIMYSYYCLY